MKKLINDPQDVVAESVEGFGLAHADVVHVHPDPLYVTRAGGTVPGKVGLVSGGDRFDARVTTANGGVGAKRVVLRDVRVGSVKVLDVAAVVLTRGAMNENLLGMSFLGRLRRVETARDRLTLER